MNSEFSRSRRSVSSSISFVVVFSAGSSRRRKTTARSRSRVRVVKLDVEPGSLKLMRLRMVLWFVRVSSVFWQRNPGPTRASGSPTSGPGATSSAPLPGGLVREGTNDTFPRSVRPRTGDRRRARSGLRITDLSRAAPSSSFLLAWPLSSLAVVSRSRERESRDPTDTTNEPAG